jgi:hypothetical protein
VTPKSTSDDGPAIRFNRRSRGSRKGFPDRPADLCRSKYLAWLILCLSFRVRWTCLGQSRDDLLELGNARCPVGEVQAQHGPAMAFSTWASPEAWACNELAERERTLRDLKVWYLTLP